MDNSTTSSSTARQSYQAVVRKRRGQYKHYEPGQIKSFLFNYFCLKMTLDEASRNSGVTKSTGRRYVKKCRDNKSELTKFGICFRTNTQDRLQRQPENIQYRFTKFK